MPLTPGQLKEMVACLKNPAGRDDRRRTARLQVQATTNISPLHPDGQRDESFTVLARDISLEGAGLISSVPLASQSQILIHLPSDDEGSYVVCAVKHCTPIADGIYSHGVQFLRMFKSDGAEPPVEAEGIEKVVELVLL